MNSLVTIERQDEFNQFYGVLLKLISKRYNMKSRKIEIEKPRGPRDDWHQ